MGRGIFALFLLFLVTIIHAQETYIFNLQGVNTEGSNIVLSYGNGEIIAVSISKLCDPCDEAEIELNKGLKDLLPEKPLIQGIKSWKKDGNVCYSTKSVVLISYEQKETRLRVPASKMKGCKK